MISGTALRGNQLENPRRSPDRDQRQVRALVQVSRAIGTIVDQRELMSAIMEQATEVFAAERSSLYLHDATSGELVTMVAQGLGRELKEIRIPEDQGLCGRVFQTQESLCLADVSNHRFFSRRLAERVGYVPHSMLIAPVLHVGCRCVGVLQVMDRRVARFEEEDVPLLEAIAAQVAISLENARLHQAQVRQFESFVRALSAALDARDSMTAIHSVNVANYSMGIAIELGLGREEIEWLRIAGLLHDIGKIGVRESVLTKQGPLSSEEYEQMKRHAGQSRAILEQIEFTDALGDMAVVAAAHHERLDGSGYPDGLAGNEIPMRARILAVADVFDALTQARHYRAGGSVKQAFAILDEMCPRQLDDRCVSALKRFMGFTE